MCYYYLLFRFTHVSGWPQLIKQRLMLNFKFFCLYLLGVTGLYHQAQFTQCPGSNPGLTVCQAGALPTETHLQPASIHSFKEINAITTPIRMMTKMINSPLPPSHVPTKLGYRPQMVRREWGCLLVRFCLPGSPLMLLQRVCGE